MKIKSGPPQRAQPSATAAPSVVARATRVPDLGESRAPVSGTSSITGSMKAPQPLGAATVIGAGPAGLAQAILLMKRAGDTGLTKLTVVERREQYTRPVALFFRTMTLDALAWLDEEAFAELEKRSGMRDAQGNPKGLVSERLDAQGNVVTRIVRDRDEADPSRFASEALDATRPIADVADEMFRPPTLSLITMKDLEDVLWDALPRIAAKNGVTLDVRRGWEAEILEDAAQPGTASVVLHELVKKDDGGEKRLVRSGKQDALPKQGVVVLTEGSGARVRGKLASTAVANVGPSEKILAAGLEGSAAATSVGRGGMSTWTDDQGVEHPVRLARGCNGETGVQWTVVGVPGPVCFDATSAQTHARDVDAWLHRYAGLAGDVDLPFVFGPVLGEVKGTLVDKAVRGDNLVLCGDVVGTSHFSSAGGAATAVTTHVAAMNRFLDDVATGAPRKASLSRLDEDLRTASLTWAIYGLREFHGDPWALRETFLPKALLEKLLPASHVERYWPASGGAPVDDKSPWTPWFEKHGQKHAEKLADQKAAVPADGASLGALERALDRGDAGAARATTAPVTSSAWAAILAAPAPTPSPAP